MRRRRLRTAMAHRAGRELADAFQDARLICAACAASHEDQSAHVRFTSQAYEQSGCQRISRAPTCPVSTPTRARRRCVSRIDGACATNAAQRYCDDASALTLVKIVAAR